MRQKFLNKNKKGQIGFGGIIMLFVGIIFSIALLAPIFDTQAQLTTKQVINNQSVSTVTAYINEGTVNESFNFTIYTQKAWKQIECPLTSVAIRNGVGTSLVLDTDYTLYASNGVYSLLNTSLTQPDIALNLTYADATYCADGYNTNQGSRSIARLIGLFSMLILLAFVLEISGVTNWSDKFS